MALAAIAGSVLIVGASARAQSYTLTTLASFNGTNGAFPKGGLALDSHGNLYGACSNSVFEIAAGTNTITTLASSTDNNGSDAYGGVGLDGQGNVYGTTEQGGANHYGSVYEVAAGASAITTLASFGGGNGANPYGDVTVGGPGDVYGTTLGGGTNGGGTVFEAVGSTITTLANLGTFGFEPYGGVTFGNGNLYGTVSSGGAGDLGGVYAIAAGANIVTPVASFTGTNGSTPFGGVTLDSHGNLYGTAFSGGAFGEGVVWEIAAGTNTITTLASFNGTDGAQPSGTLTLGSNGNLYGTTQAGGADSDGAVFEIVAGTSTITDLTFFNVTDGEEPLGALLLGSNGALYGSTLSGGASGEGTVFALTPTGAATTPEPAAVALVLTGSLAVAARRRRA